MMKKIEDICYILDRKRVPITASNREPGPYPYYGANGVQDYVTGFLFDDELVLLAEDGGNFGSKDKPIAYRVSVKCWVNNHAHVLKPKEGVDVDYLCYALMFYDVSSIVNGATRQKLTQADMRKMEIYLPSIEEQCKIVKVLNKVCDLISYRQQQLAKLDELVKARFVEMFASISNIVNMEDVCKIITDGTHQPPKFTTEGIPFLFVSNIITNKICYDAEKFITEEVYTELVKRTPIEMGDVLLSTVGSYGHPAVVKSERPFCFQRHIAYLKPDRDRINSEYLHSAILSDEVQRQIDERVKGIAQKTLNLSEIRKLQFPLPSIEKQNQFAAFVGQIDKSKISIKKSIEQMEILKRALMQQYFE